MKIHLIGIGGIGTSALARIFNEKKHEVSGSDMEDSELLEDLRKEGIKVVIGHDASNIPKKCDFVVYSEAIPKENFELQAARSQSIPCRTYFETLGDITKEHKTIAVCGAHGKTTVTAMAAKMMIDAGLDPTIVIGSKMRELDNKNYRLGKSEWMIVEACEYRRSFLHIHPDVIILTNIEYEHPDYYKDFADYKDAFDSFISKLPNSGKLITASPKVHFNLNVPGEFNKENAGLVMELAEYLKIDREKAQKSLQEFSGTWRRFEMKGKIGNTMVIDDYGHHPTEIRTTLRAVRQKWPSAKILCVFQPHQYSRTYEFLDEFAKSFKDVDQVIIPNIYRVRDSEEAVSKVTPEKLVEEINKVTKNARYGKGLEKTAENFEKEAVKFDVVIVMGAGDVWKVITPSSK